MTDRRLEGRTAVVTGAGSGIGWAIAHRLAAEGANVVCADVSGREDDAARSIGGAAVSMRVDVSQRADIERMIAGALDRFGTLDILCNNAGFGGGMRPLTEFSEDDYDTLMAVNLKGVFLGLRSAIPVMVEQGRGSIVNTASAAGLVGFRHHSVYGAAKAGVIQLTKAAALDYADTGVRVNAICPGMTYTGLAGAAPGTPPPSGEHLPTPMKRWGLADELAAAAAFLASDDASFITGVALPVDGGYAASGLKMPGH